MLRKQKESFDLLSPETEPSTVAGLYVANVEDILGGVIQRAHEKRIGRKRVLANGIKIERREPSRSEDDARFLASRQPGAFLWRADHVTQLLLHRPVLEGGTRPTVDGDGYLLRMQWLNSDKRPLPEISEKVVPIDVNNRPIVEIRETMTGKHGYDWGYKFFSNGQVQEYRPASEFSEATWVEVSPQSERLQADISILDGDIRHELLGIASVAEEQ